MLMCCKHQLIRIWGDLHIINKRQMCRGMYVPWQILIIIITSTQPGLHHTNIKHITYTKSTNTVLLDMITQFLKQSIQSFITMKNWFATVFRNNIIFIRFSLVPIILIIIIDIINKKFLPFLMLLNLIDVYRKRKQINNIGFFHTLLPLLNRTLRRRKCSLMLHETPTFATTFP